MSDLQTVRVSDDDDGQRLDRWLKRNAPHVPYVLVQKLIRKGQIRIDGKRTKSDVKLSAGQEVRLPPLTQNKTRSKAPEKLSPRDAEFIRSLVIYDQGDIVALNKPPGLAVQGGTKTNRHIDGMLDALIGKDGVRPRLVHRLDKDTSGVLLLARSQKMAKALGVLFKGQKIKKIYWALVSPTPELHVGAIKAPLAKMGGANREKMALDEENGKFALTEYTVLEHALDKVAFLAFWPRTGRTHQIRVHAQLMGSPILGDMKYKQLQEVEDPPDIKVNNLHLHAVRVMFTNPLNKRQVDITAKLPKELLESWRNLGFNPDYKTDPFEHIK